MSTRHLGRRCEVAIFGTAALGLGLALAAGCGSTPRMKAAPGGSVEASKWPADDKSLCEPIVHWRANPALQVNETVGPGSFRPNIRRIYKTVGERDDRHQLLVCRELDSNLDGLKDVVRLFNDKGEPLHEETDTNYDGLIDDWVKFADGRIAEEDLDTTLSAGRPNVWKFYLGGTLTRIKRNTHCPSGKPDVWEIYFKNRLERIGTDVTCDGHVDRWDRDAQLMAEEDQVQIVDSGAPHPAAAAPNDDAGAPPAATPDAGSTDAGKKKPPPTKGK